jgi:hypothetical protein
MHHTLQLRWTSLALPRLKANLQVKCVRRHSLKLLDGGGIPFVEITAHDDAPHTGPLAVTEAVRYP